MLKKGVFSICFSANASITARSFKQCGHVMSKETKPMDIPREIKEINEIIEVTDRPEFTLMRRYETGTDEQKYIMVTALAVMAIERERREKDVMVIPERNDSPDLRWQEPEWDVVIR
ncbi:hypothetical protein ECED1_1108 [Escherichia coli ED1a]|nr:hypothetical protein ECED1_1108 [Escherichia coli ED1a]